MRNMDLGIKNRVAVVTGASTGIGFAISKNLSIAGVKVLLVSRNAKKLKKAIKEIKASGGCDADFIVGDVSKVLTAKKVVKRCLKKWKKIDILINNSGGHPPGGLLKQNEKNWSFAIQNNLMSVIRFTKEVIPIMQKNKWGRIVTIGSTIAKEPTPEMILSATSRGGLAAFTKAVGINFAKDNISANVISPGAILTERFIKLVKIAAKNEKKKYSEKLSDVKMNIPARRIAKPDEIAYAAIFLASELGAYINGVDLSIDGAFTKGY